MPDEQFLVPCRLENSQKSSNLAPSFFHCIMKLKFVVSSVIMSYQNSSIGQARAVSITYIMF